MQFVRRPRFDPFADPPPLLLCTVTGTDILVETRGGREDRRRAFVFESQTGGYTVLNPS